MKTPDYDVIVIGGGPAGATCATLLAREGRRVLVLEKHAFPRFHIGESITAFGTDLFKDLGVYEDLKEQNYIRKRGLEFCLHGKSKRLYFPDTGRDEDGHLPWAFQMPRERLDRTLLDNARKHGAEVREGRAVERVLFDGDRAVGARWTEPAENGTPAETREATARWIIDASGGGGVLNRQLQGNCRDHHLLQKKVALFAHFRAPFDFENGDDEIHFKLCVHENGRDWAWWLPIDRDLCSVGVVLTRETVKEREGTLDELFDETIAKTAFLSEFMRQPMERVGDKLHTVVDYSYVSERHSGPGWALVGDAAGFIDPVFSTGLQITFNSAFQLGAAVNKILDDPANEAEARAGYDKIVDRYYRVNGTLVTLFYTAKIDPYKYENSWYMWKNIPFASWKYRLLFLFWGAQLFFRSRKKVLAWSEQVVFGNPEPGNRVADMFMMLSRNFDAYYAKQIAARPVHEAQAEPEPDFVLTPAPRGGPTEAAAAPSAPASEAEPRA